MNNVPVPDADAQQHNPKFPELFNRIVVLGLLFALLAGYLCFRYVDVDSWKSATFSAAAISAVILAAALFRVMRAFPIVSPDCFTDEQAIDKLEKSYRLMCKENKALVFTTLITMVHAGFIPNLLPLEKLPTFSQKLVSGGAGFLVALIIGMVLSTAMHYDYQLIRLHAACVRQAFRKHKRATSTQNNQS